VFASRNSTRALAAGLPHQYDIYYGQSHLKGDIFECSFKTQNPKFERFFSLKRGKRGVRALSLSFETTFENVTPSGIGCVALSY